MAFKSGGSGGPTYQQLLWAPMVVWGPSSLFSYLKTDFDGVRPKKDNCKLLNGNYLPSQSFQFLLIFIYTHGSILKTICDLLKDYPWFCNNLRQLRKWPNTLIDPFISRCFWLSYFCGSLCSWILRCTFNLFHDTLRHFIEAFTKHRAFISTSVIYRDRIGMGLGLGWGKGWGWAGLHCPLAASPLLETCCEFVPKETALAWTVSSQLANASQLITVSSTAVVTNSCSVRIPMTGTPNSQICAWILINIWPAAFLNLITNAQWGYLCPQSDQTNSRWVPVLA